MSRTQAQLDLIPPPRPGCQLAADNQPGTDRQSRIRMDYVRRRGVQIRITSVPFPTADAIGCARARARPRNRFRGLHADVDRALVRDPEVTPFNYGRTWHTMPRRRMQLRRLGSPTSRMRASLFSRTSGLEKLAFRHDETSPRSDDPSIFRGYLESRERGYLYDLFVQVEFGCSSLAEIRSL